ncbi:hypothetical protein T02_12817 [Trichinella nativa]|uniref:Uncharacterized protein n=1 Tax=Trichinella nativa TaxID=6335 RepID=A0A0V1KWX6_9BILA|nr:hypothetical protein T02_12817 [Trichinella nativa]
MDISCLMGNDVVFLETLRTFGRNLNIFHLPRLEKKTNTYTLERNIAHASRVVWLNVVNIDQIGLEASKIDFCKSRISENRRRQRRRRMGNLNRVSNSRNPGANRSRVKRFEEDRICQWRQLMNPKSSTDRILLNLEKCKGKSVTGLAWRFDLASIVDRQTWQVYQLKVAEEEEEEDG